MTVWVTVGAGEGVAVTVTVGAGVGAGDGEGEVVVSFTPEAAFPLKVTDDVPEKCTDEGEGEK